MRDKVVGKLQVTAAPDGTHDKHRRCLAPEHRRDPRLSEGHVDSSSLSSEFDKAHDLLMGDLGAPILLTSLDIFGVVEVSTRYTGLGFVLVVLYALLGEHA